MNTNEKLEHVMNLLRLAEDLLDEQGEDTASISISVRIAYVKAAKMASSTKIPALAINALKHNQIMKEVDANRKIHAVKAIRYQYDVGLLDAKAIYDRIKYNQNS